VSSPSTVAALRYPAFRTMVSGRVITMFGNAMAPIALAFAVLDLTGSAGDLGLVVGARSVANVLLLLFGGVVADRLPRGVVMVASNLLAAASQGAVAALVLGGRATVPSLAVLGVVNGTASAFAMPAVSALVAQTVPAEIRKTANAINRLGINAAMITGASVGGLLVATFGPGWGLVVDAATFAVGALFFSRVRVASHREQRTARASTLHEIREGWSEFTSHRWLWVVVLGFCFFNMAETAVRAVLGPAVADATFGRQAWGLVLAAQTAGMVAGAVVAMRTRVRRLLYLGVLCCGVETSLGASLALAPRVEILLPVAFVAGVALEQFGIAWETSMQEHITADKLARVYSYDALGSFIAMPVGQIAAGPLADSVGFRAALLAAAALGLLAVVGMLSSRSVRTLRHRPATDTSPLVLDASVPVAAAPP
jgi:MFS family permease